MSNLDIYNKWYDFINNEKYKTYFISNEDEWKNNLKELKIYIDNNNKRPSQCNKNNNIKILGNWIQNQIRNYKEKTYIMTNIEIYNDWTNFINDDKYKKYFI